jgi:hypothetical protein
MVTAALVDNLNRSSGQGRLDHSLQLGEISHQPATESRAASSISSTRTNFTRGRP